MRIEIVLRKYIVVRMVADQEQMVEINIQITNLLLDNMRKNHV